MPTGSCSGLKRIFAQMRLRRSMLAPAWLRRYLAPLQQCQSRLRHRDAAWRLGPRSSGDDLIPPSGRRRANGRGDGLSFANKGLDGKARHVERRTVKMRGHVVSLLRCLLIALCGGERKPFEGFREILLDPDSARIQDAEIVLAVRDGVARG